MESQIHYVRHVLLSGRGGEPQGEEEREQKGKVSHIWESFASSRGRCLCVFGVQLRTSLKSGTEIAREEFSRTNAG